MTGTFEASAAAEDSTEFIIFDTEYTTWEGAQERRWLGRSEFKEIIEVGAIKVRWPAGEVLGELMLIVRPKINPILSRYCADLTRISQDILDRQGIPFEDALREFCDFCEGKVAISYGNDASVIAENIMLNRADPINFYGRGSPSFLNIKYWLTQNQDRMETVSSGELWKFFGGRKPSNFKHEHNSISDCYSILQAMLHLRKNRLPLPF